MADRVMLGQGDRVAGYEVEAVIAHGGMGVVYRAHQAGLGRSVALKVIAADRTADPVFRARFVREAQLAASLDHPNVIPIFDAGEHDGELFIAMRLVDGRDLDRLIAASGPLDVGLACRIVGQAAAGLDAAHRAGLVHRDVKPANILLSGPADDPHVYVSDFGVAKSAVAAGSLTHPAEWVGTPGYAAPEQIRGEPVDGRADVYALGCVLLAALTRRAGGPAPQLPAAVAAVIDRATAASPSARFQTAGELADALRVAVRPTGHAPAATLPAATRPLGEGRSAQAGPAAGRPSLGSRRSGERDASGAGRPRRWPALGFVVGFVAIVAGVVAVALLGGGGGGSHARRSVSPPVGTVPVVGTPAAAGGGDTVFCGPAACRQSGAAVLVPIEGGSCVRGGLAGTWTRLDAGAPEPMVICLPGTNMARVGVAVAVPTLTGGRLDHVETALDRLGIPYRTSGGGLFGIISTDNWTVCATQPVAGGQLAVASEVTVFVEHTC